MDSNSRLLPKDLADLSYAVSQTRPNAIKCWDPNRDEERYEVKDNSLISAMNIQSQNIDSRVIEKADCAFSLNGNNQSVGNLLRHFERQQQLIRHNQILEEIFSYPIMVLTHEYELFTTLRRGSCTLEKQEATRPIVRHIKESCSMVDNFYTFCPKNPNFYFKLC